MAATQFVERGLGAGHLLAARSITWLVGRDREVPFGRQDARASSFAALAAPAFRALCGRGHPHARRVAGARTRPRMEAATWVVGV